MFKKTKHVKKKKLLTWILEKNLLYCDVGTIFNKMILSPPASFLIGGADTVSTSTIGIYIIFVKTYKNATHIFII